MCIAIILCLEEEDVLYKKNTVFVLGRTRVIATEDIYKNDEEQEYFILNLRDSFSNEDTEVIPVIFIPYTNDKQLYELRKIILYREIQRTHV